MSVRSPSTPLRRTLLTSHSLFRAGRPGTPGRPNAYQRAPKRKDLRAWRLVSRLCPGDNNAALVSSQHIATTELTAALAPPVTRSQCLQKTMSGYLCFVIGRLGSPTVRSCGSDRLPASFPAPGDPVMSHMSLPGPSRHFALGREPMKKSNAWRATGSTCGHRCGLA